tara:strand:+ start:18353 stop:19312 length:960 start_codon:yes stop_codon:yes gene_type:complete
MPTHGPITTEPTCPRCGYDQSGEVATWSEACPLEGRCPECGTRFRWSDLYDPARQDFPWLVEHTRSIRQRARRTLPTLSRLALPWVFWARVDVHARTDPRAVAGWLVMLFVVLHLLCWLPVSLLIAAIDRGVWLTFADLGAMIAALSAIEVGAGLITGLLWPLAFVSGSGYWMWGSNFYNGAAFLSAWRFPIGMGLTWFVIMSALPVTRRMAMLRRTHLWRALLFQLTSIVVGFSLLRLLFWVALGTAGNWAEIAYLVVFVLVCLWTMVWWICALSIGWKIRSWVLMTLGTVASIFGGAALVTIEMSVSQILWYLGAGR